MSTALRVPLFQLEELALAEQDPEYVLAYWPVFLYGRLRDRVRRDGWWELLTVAEYNGGGFARDGWSVGGYPDSDPAALAAWATGLLGYPVDLEPGDHAVKACGARWARWHSVPLYWVRRNT